MQNYGDAHKVRRQQQANEQANKNATREKKACTHRNGWALTFHIIFLLIWLFFFLFTSFVHTFCIVSFFFLNGTVVHVLNATISWLFLQQLFSVAHNSIIIWLKFQFLCQHFHCWSTQMAFTNTKKLTAKQVCALTINCRVPNWFQLSFGDLFFCVFAFCSDLLVCWLEFSAWAYINQVCTSLRWFSICFPWPNERRQSSTDLRRKRWRRR